MKNTSSLPAAALLLSFAAILFPACDKCRPDGPNRNNPPVADLPSAAFTLRVLDHERGFHPDSAYIFEGIWHDGHFWFGRQKLDTMQLNIAPDNALVLEVSSDDPAFEGVNAASSTRSIDIIPDTRDRRIYHLERIAEGRSEITLWNGDGPSRREIRFTVTSRAEIPLEGIKVRINGEVIEMFSGFNYALPEGLDYTMSEYAKAVRDFKGYKREDFNTHVDFDIIGGIPLNANKAVLHIAFDDIGIIDHGNMHENVPPHVWLKAWNLYEENIWHNSEFNWFQFYDPGYHSDDSWGASYLKMPQTYFENPGYSINPQDLRERFAWVWPLASGLIQVLAFGKGNIYFSPERNMYCYDTVYQFAITFSNTTFDNVWWSRNRNIETGY
jgi:hypothetical protein